MQYICEMFANREENPECCSGDVKCWKHELKGLMIERVEGIEHPGPLDWSIFASLVPTLNTGHEVQDMSFDVRIGSLMYIVRGHWYLFTIFMCSEGLINLLGVLCAGFVKEIALLETLSNAFVNVLQQVMAAWSPTYFIVQPSADCCNADACIPVVSGMEDRQDCSIWFHS
ncbi:hypothetical protein CDL15_Pgr010499 [Punica granatum]|uniref:Uncharacterized protein n=1 Tax=Punica granatum TaxID=22663 RepID=A0A218XY44_PUNGR|nr:hypothetical protein CDL15_Pgr010499 [Punica granatum]